MLTTSADALQPAPEAGKRAVALAPRGARAFNRAVHSPRPRLLGCRVVRTGRLSTHARRTAAALAGTALLLAAAPGAQADDPGESNGRAAELRSQNAALAARERSALLELYALEASLDRAERRVEALRRRTAVVERERAAAEERLGLIKRMLAQAEERLASRLRALYIQDDPDPVAVLLGAESLDDALGTLDSLRRFAGQDRTIVEQVRDARVAVRTAIRSLAVREARLRAVTASAESARAALARAREERAAYVARLAAERRLNEREIARLAARAAEIEAKAATIAADAGAPVRAPSPPAGPGTKLTVVATGYALPGTTATGAPVGWGVVAVDPSVIPLGTRMTIPGYGEGVAADTGSAVKGAIIDLWFPTRAQALAWGRRTVTITLH